MGKTKGSNEFYFAAPTIERCLEQKVCEKIEGLKPRLQPAGENKDCENVALSGDLQRPVRVGQQFDSNQKQMLVRCLEDNQDAFTWSCADNKVWTV